MTAIEHPYGTGIDKDRLAICLAVLDELHTVPQDHPDHVAVRRATAQMFKSVKKHRRAEKRDAIATADRAVIGATATGSPNRIDDETQGIALVSTMAGASAGTLITPRACYICKTKYQQVDAFYHQLCPSCAALNRARREARTDLSGRRALLTGGRAKIGMYIALRLLRDGAHTTITTRFPNDAVAPVHRDGRQRRLAAPVADRRHRPARPGAGDRAGRLGDRAGPAGHPDQQRRPDRPALPRRVRPARRGRVRAAAGRAAAAS